MAPSSSGLGREPLTLETGVRFSVGSPKNDTANVKIMLGMQRFGVAT